MTGEPTASSTGENRAPVIERVRIEPEEPLAGGRVRAIVQSADPDGGSVRLRYAWTLDGAPTGGDAPELELPQARKGQELGLEVVASDGTLETAPQRTSVRIGNRPPQLVGVALEPREAILVGALVKAVPDATDSDDDTLRFDVTWWVNGVSQKQTGVEFDTRSLRRGDSIVAEVRATDGKVTTEPRKSAALSIGNSPPKIVSRPETRFEDGVFQYDVQAKDPDGDRTLRFSLTGAPQGMNIDRMGGEVRWTPRPDQAGKHAVEVVVEDGQGASDAQQFEVNIGTEKGRQAESDAVPEGEPAELPAVPAAAAEE